MYPRSLFLTVLLLVTYICITHAQQTPFTRVYYTPIGSTQACSITKTLDNHYILAGTKDYIGMALIVDGAGDISWIRKIGPYMSQLSCVTASQDSCFVLAGTKGFNQTYGDLYMVKITTAGDTVWTRSYPGSSASISSLQMTSDHGFILAGVQSDNSTTVRMLVIKLNASGQVEWSKTYLSGLVSVKQKTYGFSAREMPGGGYL